MPVRLPPNQLRRFYRGGEAIARFRGIDSAGDDAPEDWVGSTTTVFGDPEAGLSRFEDGRTLRDTVAADPEAFLGVRRREPGLLVKLLDAGERLPVHCHPDRPFARAHLGSPYGKTEAWVIVESRGDAQVGLGFRDDVDAETLANWVERQDVDALLAALNELPVRPGDVVFVPAGVPHAIGDGILMVELQEPSDLSVLLEWRGFDVDGRTDGHLGLGYDTALAAVDRSDWSHRVEGLVRSTADEVERIGLLPPEADPFFRGERLRPAPELELEPAFSILVVLAGGGSVACADGALELGRGDTVLVPFASGACTLAGDGLDAIRCAPPEEVP